MQSMSLLQLLKRTEDGLVLNLRKVGRFALIRNHFNFMGQMDKALQTHENVHLFHIS